MTNMKNTEMLRSSTAISMKCGGVLAVALLIGTVTLPAVATAKSMAEKLQQISLPDAAGKVTPLFADEKQAEVTIVCFLGSECPLAQLYGPRLQKLASGYKDGQVRVIGINSNLQDSGEDVTEFVKRHQLQYSVFKDYDHAVADLFEAKRTPEVLLLNRDLEVIYRGRIDDQYTPGTIKSAPDQHDLKNAIDDQLAGREIQTPKTEAVGCLIGRAYDGEVTTKLTYCKEIARILQKHCVECHRPAEIGPFSLTNYDEVIGWGEMMLETVQQGRMPPWHANPAHGQFANSRRMSDEEKEQLRDWVKGGMPYGNPKELPEPISYVEGWQLDRKPDLVLDMGKSPFKVPAEGVVEYQYFVVDPGFEEDRWITGAQVLPGNRAVVHHCIVFVRPPDGEKSRGLGFVAAYVPGQRSTMLPAGCGRRIPAGSRLVFQMHYTPTGTPQEDLSKLGLLFGNSEDIDSEVYTLPAINRSFEIPPQAADYAVSGETTRVPQNARMLALSPHMHYRGKSFRAVAKREDGRDILLDVPYYDFNWQHVYEMKSPLQLDGIKALEFTATFDNSSENPFNPDPSQYVTWGDQTWEEMAIAFFEIALPRGEKPVYAAAPQSEQVDEQAMAKQQAADKAAEDRFVSDFFSRFDTDGDGIVRRDEMPLAQRRYGFRKLDRNDDDRLDRDEIAAQYRERR